MKADKWIEFQDGETVEYTLTGNTFTREVINPIRYGFVDCGGFVAGNVETGITCYAYSSSEFAEAAKKFPLRTAEQMIQRESSFFQKSREMAAASKAYDERNWALLGGRK